MLQARCIQVHGNRWIGIFSAFALLVVGNGVLFLLPSGSYDAIVVHHSASSTGSLRSIRAAHRPRGWFEAAYHLVLSNGTEGVAAGELEASWRYRLGLWSVATRSPRHNLRAVHLCVVGNYETSPLPASLERPLGHAVSALQRRYGISDSEIYLHRECSPTACPGKHIDRARLRSWVAGDVSLLHESLRAQHRATLASGSPSRRLYLAARIGLNLLVVVMLIRSRFGPIRRRSAR